MDRDALHEHLLHNLSTTCQCIDPQHGGEPCASTSTGYRKGRWRYFTEEWFTYACGDCQQAGHHPYLAYDREGISLGYGQVHNLDGGACEPLLR
jgi:hypothetical protein